MSFALFILHIYHIGHVTSLAGQAIFVEFTEKPLASIHKSGALSAAAN
jgi:hypothetical protein